MTQAALKEEALDRTQMVSFVVGEHLKSHAFIAAHPDLAAICSRIERELAELYRAVAATESGDAAA